MRMLSKRALALMAVFLVAATAATAATAFADTKKLRTVAAEQAADNVQAVSKAHLRAKVQAMSNRRVGNVGVIAIPRVKR